LSIKSCVGVGDIAVLSERWAGKNDQNDHVENKSAPLRPRNCMFDAYMKDSTHIEVKVTLCVFICVISIRYNSLSLGGSGVDFGPILPHTHDWITDHYIFHCSFPKDHQDNNFESMIITLFKLTGWRNGYHWSSSQRMEKSHTNNPFSKSLFFYFLHGCLSTPST